MTTKITVDAHAGWPVEVTRHPIPAGEPTVIVVPAKTVQDFYVWADCYLEIREIQPAKRDGA